jgi:hypothetical protein
MFFSVKKILQRGIYRFGAACEIIFRHLVICGDIRIKSFVEKIMECLIGDRLVLVFGLRYGM